MAEAQLLVRPKAPGPPVLTIEALETPASVQSLMDELRQHLAGNAVGVTRDEAIADAALKLLFCKLEDERSARPGVPLRFQALPGEEAGETVARIQKLFAEVRNRHAALFVDATTLGLDGRSVVWVVKHLQGFHFLSARRDVIGEAYEVFISGGLRGGEGQFFTPRNVIQLLVEMVGVRPSDRVIDPACGSGGFLFAAAAGRNGGLVTEGLHGIDKDEFLALAAARHLAAAFGEPGQISCENSLDVPSAWSAETQASIELASFDVVLTNPPFGSKIPIRDETLLDQYDLASQWRDNEAGVPEQIQGARVTVRPPQILFIERCVQLAKPGGRIGVVLPESMLGSPSYAYVRQWILDHCTVRAIVTLPEDLFKTGGKSGTHAKACLLLLEKGSRTAQPPVFMAEAVWCGHDSRGKPTMATLPDGRTELLDDLPTIAKRWAMHISGALGEGHDHLGFVVPSDALQSLIWVPKFYDPEVKASLVRHSKLFDWKSIGGLINEGIIGVATGVEVGKMAYGTGPIPFIRTSDLANWELKIDVKHGVSTEIFDSHRAKGRLQAGDILMVRDGTYLIGTCAMVTDDCGPMLFQSHLLRFRVKRPDLLDPYLFFAALNSKVVQQQVQSVRFTQDIIDTIGARYKDLKVPIPRSPETRNAWQTGVRRIVEGRATLRSEARDFVQGQLPGV